LLTCLENETYRRLGVGPLLGDILDRFTNYASSNTPVSPLSFSPTSSSATQKMALYGTHDSTIAALLATLGVFDNKWPCFTSNITFELFRAKKQDGFWGFLPGFRTGDNGKEFFVRVKYNQGIVELPGMLPHYIYYLSLLRTGLITFFLTQDCLFRFP
jgi:acid phosphatase